MMNHSKYCLLGLLAVMIVGGTLRAWPIAQRPFWFDESDTWRSAIGTTPDGIKYTQFANWTVHFETPPLAFLLARVSADLFNPAQPSVDTPQIRRPKPWAMRMGALVCGIMMIPAVFVLGRVVHGDVVGLIGATLVAFDPNMVDQSQQCRMYALLALQMVIAMIWAVVLLRRPDRGWGHWLGLGLSLGLLLWTLQFGLVAWGGIAMATGLLLVAGYVTGQAHPQAGRLIVGMTLTYLFGMLVACIGVYQLVDRVLTGEGDASGMPLGAIAREIVVYAKDLVRVPPMMIGSMDLTPVGLLIYPLAAVGLVLLFKRCKTSTAVLVCVALANLMILFPFRRMHHFMDPRYLTGFQPAMWIGLAMLPVALAKRPWRMVGGALVLVYVGMQAWQSVNIDQWWAQPDRYLLAPAIVETRDQMQPDDAVAFHPQVIEVLARYYDCAPHAELEAGLYDGVRLRDEPAIDHSFDAPTTWLVLGMINYPGRLPKANRTIDVLASHYGVQVDEAQRAQHVQENRVVVVRVDAQGVVFESHGVDDRG